MNKLVVFIFAASLGMAFAILADFFSDRMVFMGQFIITIGFILYADIIYEINNLRSEVNKNEYYRKKNKSKKQ